MSTPTHTGHPRPVQVGFGAASLKTGRTAIQTDPPNGRRSERPPPLHRFTLMAPTARQTRSKCRYRNVSGERDLLHQRAIETNSDAAFAPTLG